MKNRSISIERNSISGYYTASTIIGDQYVKARGDTKKGAIKLLKDLIKEELQKII